ncbi:MAG: right-handed parallel beta-helix repeat-containing protein [Sedimentisphaerales bacterium]
MKKSCGDEMKMTRRHFFVLAVAFLLSHSLSISFGAGASFQGLGVPSGSTRCVASDVSADGTVVVGWILFDSYDREAFRWTPSGGIKGLGDIPGGSHHDFFSMATGVSGDGSVVVGHSEGASGQEAFRWTESTGMVGLGDLGGGLFYSTAEAISYDGSVIVGQVYSSLGYEAFRWTESGGMVGIGDLPGGSFNSQASGVSHNGWIIVGIGRTDSRPEPFLWRGFGDMVGLGLLPGAGNGWAEAVSASGSVVVGICSYELWTEAFRWTESGGMLNLGRGSAQDISADGSMIVGSSLLGAYIWDEQNGMRSIKDMLENDFGLNLNGWHLSVAMAISPDGSTIVGYGPNPQGYNEAWIAMLPKPPTIIIRVDGDANGANDGSSWSDAYNYLQDALAAAKSGHEIRVAQGVYTPDINSADPNGSGDREATFQPISGVTIKGGYAGFGEPDPDARDIQLYETILRGDLKGNDIDVNGPPQSYNDPCRAENSYHVVTCYGMYTIDGFTITGGNANHYEEETDSGGGMYNKYGSPTVINCTFRSNSAGNDGLGGGGGMYNYYSSPTVINCIFSNNAAVYNCGGGGIRNYYSHPTFSNCTFSGNTAEYCGGGMYNNWSNPTLTNCTFADNFAPFRGGGIHNDYGSFRPTFTNCTFISNHSDVDGGAIYNFGDCSPTITKCTFSNNSAGENGGGIANCFGNSPKLKNCLFTGNWAGQDGGGIYNYGYDTSEVTTVTNSTFIGNFALNGNALACDSYYQDYPSNHEISNCIFNDGDEIWNNDGSTINISYTNLWGGQAACYDPCGAIVWGLGNIDADPCFALPGYWGDSNDLNIIVEPNDPNAIWVDGDYHLKSRAGRWDANSETWVYDTNTSPCIDAGDPNSDCTGEFWPHGERINMGAYGGTPEASMSLSNAGSAADLNLDGCSDYRDTKLFIEKWLYEALLLPEDLSRDGIVDFTDFAIFAHYFELPARHPNPGDGASVVSRTADLSWTAGRGATSHDVYFGTSSPPPPIQNQAGTTFDPGTMDYSTVYYWRIDEVSAYGTFTGVVWSFRTTGPGPG